MSLLTRKTLSLQLADQIASAAIRAAEDEAFAPIAVCVMDPSGHSIVTKRMDGCPAMAYPKISEAKANICVATKSSSRAYGDKYLKNASDPQEPARPDVFARVLNQIGILGGKAAAFPGGVLVRDGADGSIVGSVGVSGAAGAQDEYCAIMGVRGCGLSGELVTEPAEHSL